MDVLISLHACSSLYLQATSPVQDWGGHGGICGLVDICGRNYDSCCRIYPCKRSYRLSSRRQCMMISSPVSLPRVSHLLSDFRVTVHLVGEKMDRELLFSASCIICFPFLSWSLFYFPSCSWNVVLSPHLPYLPLNYYQKIPGSLVGIWVASTV